MFVRGCQAGMGASKCTGTSSCDMKKALGEKN